METPNLNIKYVTGPIDFKQIENSIRLFSSDAVFSRNTWFCDKKKQSAAIEDHKYTIYFTSVPDKYKTLIKHFVLKTLNDGRSVGTVKNYIKGFVHFCTFIEKNKVELKDVNNESVLVFKQYLINLRCSDTYKHEIWSHLNVIFKTTITWYGTPNIDYFKGANPFPKNINNDYKYIPNYVISQLDKVFRNKVIPLYLRVFYWIARSIPSRANEVLGMKWNCLKPHGEDWVIFMPTWKQNGGYVIAQIRRIYLRYEGHGKFLIDLIRELQKEAEEFQGKMNEEDKGMLFTRAQYTFKNGKYLRSTTKPLLTKLSALSVVLDKICIRDNITTEDGAIYEFNTHQLRHNGITDRLYAGFTPIQIALTTDHQSHEMIITSYNHKQTEKLLEKQRIVHNEQVKKPIYFNGRILNMDENLEKRLLSNIRAHRIKNLGICSDITGCESNLFECLDCDFLVPDANDLPYFEEQVRNFEEKLVKFKDHPYLRENTAYNLELHKRIVERIKRILEGGIT